MRNRSIFAVLLILALVLTGCGGESPPLPETQSAATQELTRTETEAAPTETTPPTQVPTEATLPVQTEAPTVQAPTETLPPVQTEAPAIQESAATEAPTAAAPDFREVPYTQHIPHWDQSVYSGPGYDYGRSATVRNVGTYTIVEEAADSEGNLWGRLKSGIGWVNLTEIRSEAYINALLSANFADQSLLSSGIYHHYTTAREYTIPIAFRAYGNLRDVTLFAMEFSPEGYVPGEDLYTLPEMTTALPLVAELDFPGDMTTYGIRFLDEHDVSHVFSIYISGRNGDLLLNEG